MVERLTSIPPEVDRLIGAFEVAPLRRRHQDVLHDETVSAPLWLHFNLTAIFVASGLALRFLHARRVL
jgi:hypothetical protein